MCSPEKSLWMGSLHAHQYGLSSRMSMEEDILNGFYCYVQIRWVMVLEISYVLSLNYGISAVALM